MRRAPLLAFCGFVALSVPAVLAAHGEPAWVNNTPIVMSGSWDHVAIFETRLGTATVDAADEFRREQSEETVRHLHDLGVTLVIVPFFKGFGLEAEKDAIAITRGMVPIYHRYGIRVGVYVGSTIAYESFLAEEPGAKDWFVPDYEGQPVRYFNQYFRKRVYFMHPGYRAYIKRVLRLAIQDVHADLIHFDNTSLQAAIPIFHHPMAEADFRAYLRAKYTPAQLKNRLGFSDVSFVEAPHIPPYPGGISDPLAQEWTDFRCHQLQAYYAEMTGYIRSLNPEVADDCNPSAGLNGTPTIWLQGVDYPRLVPQVDFVWSEEGSKVGLESDGVLWSKIRTYKMATYLGRRIFTYTCSSGTGPMLAHAEAVDHPKLAMAEAMAFNRGCLGMVCQPLDAASMPRDRARYIKFLHENYRLLNGAHSAAEVAVLHSYASMGYDTDRPWQSTMLAEQTLLQNHIDFDIVFDSQLSDLSKYRVLVVADQESLSDGQISRIAQFVERGGGLVATEGTAIFDQRRLQRPNLKLAGRLNFQVPASDVGSSEPERGEKGKGRISAIPAIIPAKAKPAGAPMGIAYCSLPKNASALAGEVRWAAGGELSLSTDAPASVVVATAVTVDGARLVHLLNYDAAGKTRPQNISLDLRTEGRGAPSAIRVISPDAAPLTLPSRWDGAVLHIVVPRLEVYDLVVLSWPARAARLDPALPSYRSAGVPAVQGDLTITAGPLMTVWAQGFMALQPAVRVAVAKPNPTTMDALQALVDGRVEVAAGGFQRELSHQKALGQKVPEPPPLEIAVSSGGTAYHPDRPPASPALGVWVQADNPLSRLTLAQLDAIFSQTRRRGYPHDLTSWDQLGLGEAWRGQPIHRYSMSLSNQYGYPHGYVYFLTERVMSGGAFKSDTVQVADTALGSGRNNAFAEILRDVAKDRDGIAFAPFDFAGPGVKPVALAEDVAGPYYLGSREEVARRVYPLTMTNYLSARREPGRPLNPLVREFLSYVLSREGQELVAERPGHWLPLPAAFAAEQRAKLD